MELDGITEAGHTLALLGHPDLSIAVKSGSLRLVHNHSRVASQERIQNRLQEPRLGKVTTTEGQGSQHNRGGKDFTRDGEWNSMAQPLGTEGLYPSYLALLAREETLTQQWGWSAPLLHPLG